jgi:integrase
MCSFLEGLKKEELNEYQNNKKIWLEESDYSEATNANYWRMLNSNVAFREKSEQKDLYEFTQSEIIEIINGITEKQQQRSMFSIINSYMIWACERGFNYVGNPCDTIDLQDIVSIDVEMKKQSYQTLDEFYKFINDLKCSNVDKMLLILLRYGVKLNLVSDVKNSDIDEKEMRLSVYTSKYVLNYPIDEMFLKWVKRANNVTEYGGFNSEKISVGSVTYAESNTGYLLRNTMRHDKAPENEKVNVNTLYSRLNAISTNNKIIRINPGELNKARKFDFLFRAYELNGIVDSDDIKAVIDMFDGNVTNAKVVKVKNEFEIISDIKTIKLNYGIVAIQRKRQEKNEFEVQSEAKKIEEIKKNKKDIFS